MLKNRRADAYAWTAALMLFIGVPLASLSIDIVRLMYVRGHLYTATDAACQAAADALDVPYYVATGNARVNPGLGRSQAATVFRGTLVDAATIGYVDSLAVDFPGPRQAHCTATASVDRIISITPAMKVVVETTSEMRVNGR